MNFGKRVSPGRGNSGRLGSLELLVVEGLKFGGRCMICQAVSFPVISVYLCCCVFILFSLLFIIYYFYIFCVTEIS